MKAESLKDVLDRMDAAAREASLLARVAELERALVGLFGCFAEGTPEHEAFWDEAAVNDSYSDTPEAARHTSSTAVRIRAVAAARAALAGGKQVRA
jgi:hypothetical protein